MFILQIAYFPNGCNTQEENVTNTHEGYANIHASHYNEANYVHNNRRENEDVRVYVCVCMCALLYTWSLFP